jgi:hypothetical protein
MNKFGAWSAVALVSAVMLFPVVTQAMQIRQFDKMAGPDQDAYVVELVQGAERVLNEAGKTADAQAIHKLFTTNDTNGVSVGMNEFMLTLALARKADADRVIKDPNATRLEVEHAMIVTLKKNSIELPQSFMHVADNFRPKLPAR